MYLRSSNSLHSILVSVLCNIQQIKMRYPVQYCPAYIVFMVNHVVVWCLSDIGIMTSDDQ